MDESKTNSMETKLKAVIQLGEMMVMGDSSGDWDKWAGPGCILKLEQNKWNKCACVFKTDWLHDLEYR